MIFDSHMHVGSFESMFGVSLDRDGIDRNSCASTGSQAASSSIPTTSTSARWSSRSPGCTRSYWGNPRVPGYVEELREYLDHPKFIGLKLHPLIDGFHPNDPSVHPMIEAVQ